ncbi:protein phosphatase 2C domain-containing protein [Paenibacillus sp. FSL M7-1046]|uniref:protein phosphatase 2C domain-containing protein n=1 Tax=Paenibacillus sp. FSL M7-1046 TaxID=2975315 RepID=UPI0030F8A7A8
MEMERDKIKFSWVGSHAMYLDDPAAMNFGNMAIGCYGGNTAAGADKNEDGLFVLLDPDGSWEFVMLLDAHKTAESAELLVSTVDSAASEITGHLSQPISQALDALQEYLLSLFTSEAFINRCREVTGETACLLCARKENYIWWLSVGDNSLYLLHPDLAARGQFLLNQRNYYEWIGYANTFAQPVPCYSTGVRELREGHQVLVMTTDGLLEYGAQSYANPQKLFDAFYSAKDMKECIGAALMEVHQEKGRDSATVIAWSFDNKMTATMPSDQ